MGLKSLVGQGLSPLTGVFVFVVENLNSYGDAAR